MPVRPIFSLILCAAVACSGTPSEPTTAPPATATGPGHGGPPPDLDQGQQHPPIPAHSPVWEKDAGGFVPEFRWYGEQSWADVRMRVAGHLSAAGRDLARLSGARGEWAEASAIYSHVAERLAEIPVPPEGVSHDLHALLLEALRRDAALTGALARGEAPPEPEGALGLAGARARYLGLALRHRAGEDVSAEAQALQAVLRLHMAPRTDLDLDTFADFSDRHALRVRLVAAYLDALDPLGLEERWGYWEAAEVQRQARLLSIALTGLCGEAEALGELVGEAPSLAGVDPVLWPSVLADHLHSPDQQVAFTAEELGWLPTGDSLIDVGGQPGPRAIGTLEKLGLDDPQHRPWLEQTAQALAQTAAPPDTVAQVRAAAAYLDGMPHNSRYYNVKQLRNAGVRQLARAGAFPAALEILGDNWPLHHQDWACPNRAGILHALEGRLRAEAGDPRAAEVLRQALQDGEDFLRQVAGAERRQPQQTARPPR